MNWLNFHHLRYFWLTAREGSLTGASRRLRLSPSTLSSQIRTFEEHLGHPLFERRGRSLQLTPHGQVARQYAEEIFALAEEMVESMRGSAEARHAVRLRVGVSDHLPKLHTYELLSSVLHVEGQPVHLVVVESGADQLVAELAVHQLDLVLSDRPVGLATDVHAESLLLSECEVVWVGSPALRRRYHPGFPATLEGAPVLLPDRSSAIRDPLEAWFERHRVRPRVVAEIGDSALIKSFAGEGAGLVAVPRAVIEQVESQYQVEAVGVADGVKERVYAITMPGRASSGPIRTILNRSVFSKKHTTIM